MKWNTEVSVGNRKVSITEPTYFIADIAANHDGDFQRAKDLIYLAKDAGADCAKFQHFLANKIVSQKGFDSLGSNMAHQSTWKDSVVKVYDQYHFQRDWTKPLAEVCREVEIDFMTTPYDFEAIDEVFQYVPGYKIGSGDITWPNLIKRICRAGKPVFLATGAADMHDVEMAVSTALDHTKDLILMQCNTNYTGSLENFRFVNLKVLQAFAIRWPGILLGLSDHTPGHSAVLGAIALGARVVEKHFTDSNDRIGPDHGFALNPTTWRAMVDASRELEYALGTGYKIVEENEKETVVVQRRSIRVKGKLTAGTKLDDSNMECLRPCPVDAIDPRHWDEVLGRELAVAKEEGEHLCWTDLR